MRRSHEDNIWTIIANDQMSYYDKKNRHENDEVKYHWYCRC